MSRVPPRPRSIRGRPRPEWPSPGRSGGIDGKSWSDRAVGAVGSRRRGDGPRILGSPRRRGGGRRRAGERRGLPADPGQWLRRALGRSNPTSSRTGRSAAWTGPGTCSWAWTTTLVGAYQPIGWMLLELEYLAWGLDPSGYHLASLILHAANAVLLYALIRTLMARAMPDVAESRCGSVAPGDPGDVRPGRVGVRGPSAPRRGRGLGLVPAISAERRRSPCCRCWPTCAGASMGPVRPGWRFASVFLYIVALGFKAAPVGCAPRPARPGPLGAGPARRGTLPCTALLLEKVPYLIPAIAASAMAIHAKEVSLVPEPALGGLARTAAQRAAAAGYSLVYYLEATAWPCDLSAYHFRPNRWIRSSRPRRRSPAGSRRWRSWGRRLPAAPAMPGSTRRRCSPTRSCRPRTWASSSTA